MIRTSIAILAAVLSLPSAAGADPWRSAPVMGDRADAGLGLSLEGIYAMLFQDDPQGTSFTRGTGWGLRLGWNATKHLGLGSNALMLQPELVWTTSSEAQGTTAIVVSRRLDSFLLVGRLGWRLGAPSRAFRLIPYVAAGPAATFASAHYRVADPVGNGKLTEHDASELQWGAAYGAGIGISALGKQGDGLTGRIEFLRVHRSYLEALALIFGLGITL